MIRKARPEDASGLARVHVSSWQAAYRGLIDQAFLDSLDIVARAAWWERALTREENLVHVGVVNSVIEGFSSAGASSDEGWGELYAIYVTREHWGTGLGRDLLAASETALAGAGFGRALLWVLDGNTRGRAFYESQGWTLARPFRIESIGGADVTEVRYEKTLRRP